MKVKGSYIVDHKVHDCQGEATIRWAKGPLAYVSWKVYDGETLLATRSESFFSEKGTWTEMDLQKKILEAIGGYRIGRKVVFSELKIDD